MPIPHLKYPMQNNPMPPKSIGIIMDGNRRWAKEQGLGTIRGHQAGLEKIKDVIAWSLEAGAQELIFYAFSTENWNRTTEEVGALLGLIEFAFENWIAEIIEKDIRVRVIGERSRFSKVIQENIGKAEEKSKNGKRATIVFALSYGGRAEIFAAVKQLQNNKVVEITEEIFEANMWSSGLLNPDLLIRTGGEKRLSNFLPWQSVYSELFFTDTKWPALTKEEFISILADFAQRNRRRGR